MITLSKTGLYRLVETRNNTKILYLDNKAYAWIDLKKIGEVLVTAVHEHRAYSVLSSGHYTLYNVEDEDYLTDLQHLELEYGTHAWQGYLLPTGLPNEKKKRSRIIPTDQLISGIPYYQDKARMRWRLPTLRPAATIQLTGKMKGVSA